VIGASLLLQAVAIPAATPVGFELTNGLLVTLGF
jgi:hypothetical protein